MEQAIQDRANQHPTQQFKERMRRNSNSRNQTYSEGKDPNSEDGLHE